MRDSSIDILRFVGLSCIIMAHCNSPFVISQLRCFDVPLMLFVSGLACSGKDIPNYLDYIKKRAKRLLIPTWSFVTALLMIMLGAQYILHKPLLPLSYILESFAMTGGMGYVWIVRVFLLVAFITPLIMWAEKRIVKDRYLILSLLTGGGIIEVMVFCTCDLAIDSFMQRMMNEWIITILAYSLFFCLGLRMRKLETNRYWRITGTFTIILVIALTFYYYHHGLPIMLSPTYKYPPHSYYLLYGFFACSLLWSVRKYLIPIFGHKPFLFIGRNTIWIYLYHIMLLHAPLPSNWMVRYMVVYGGALFLFCLQYSVYLQLKNRYSAAKYLIG